jgi:4-amino-4-deoxy-L-arabinose transferase-like glycosyltransferase
MKRLAHWTAARRFLLLLLATRLAVGLTYSLLNPPWEAYDEDGHFAYVRYLARYQRLLQPGDPEAEAVWEKFQPPLYYALLAPLAAAFDLGATFQAPERNPYLATPNAGLNYALHPEPLTPIVLALYAGRLGSVLISTLSVIWMYGIARRVWPADARAAQTAAAVYAFWPQFLFVGSMVSNDVLATALAALTLNAALTLAHVGWRRRRIVWLGLGLFAALVTKINAFALFPVTLIAIALSWPTGGRVRLWRSPLTWVALAALLTLPVLAIVALNASPFITGQVFQLQTLAELVNHTTQSASTQQANFVAEAARYAFNTFVASYGWGNVEGYAWLYPLAGAGMALAGVGLAISVARRQHVARLTPLLLLSLHAFTLSGLALALAISQQNIFLMPGRYLLPGLPAVSCLLVTGWQALVPAGWRTRVLRLINVGMLLLGWSAPLWVIARVYTPPPPLTASMDFPLSIRFNEAIELVGYNRPAPLQPGGELRLELCWRALAPLADNYPVALVVVGADGQGYGRHATHPGEGDYPTSAWRVNVPFCDEYRLSIGSALPQRYQAQVRVALLLSADPNGERLPVTEAAMPGNVHVEADTVVIPVKVTMPPESVVTMPTSSGARFGDVLRLRGYMVQAPSTLSPHVSVTFQWEALADLEQHYTVFVHLRDAPTNAYAQADGPPLGNAFPTHLWQSGEIVLDTRTFNLNELSPPPVDLYLGVLDAAGQRLPAFDAQGQPIPNGEVILERGLRFAFTEPASVIYLPFVARHESVISALSGYP